MFCISRYVSVYAAFSCLIYNREKRRDWRMYACRDFKLLRSGRCLKPNEQHPSQPVTGTSLAVRDEMRWRNTRTRDTSHQRSKRSITRLTFTLKSYRVFHHGERLSDTFDRSRAREIIRLSDGYKFLPPAPRWRGLSHQPFPLFLPGRRGEREWGPYTANSRWAYVCATLRAG